MAITIDRDEQRTPLYTTRAKLLEVNPAIQEKLDAEVITAEQTDELLILAESLIDYLVGYHEKYFYQFEKSDERFQRQHTIFPRVQDENAAGNPFILEDIEKATQLLAGIIFEQLYADETSTSPTEIEYILEKGGSVTMHGFSVSSKGGLANSQVMGSREEFREWIRGRKNGRAFLAKIQKYTNFVGYR